MKIQNIRAVIASVALAVSCPLFQGCVAQIIMDSEDKKHYSEYRMEAERINLEREKAALTPQKIQSFNEWSGKK